MSQCQTAQNHFKIWKYYFEMIVFVSVTKSMNKRLEFSVTNSIKLCSSVTKNWRDCFSLGREKWRRKERRRAKASVKKPVDIFLLFSFLKNASTGHTHYIFSQLTHQANIVVMKLVCPGTIVSGGASPTFSVRLVKKKLVCHAVQAFFVICPCVSDLEKRKKWCILFLMSFAIFLNRYVFNMKKIKW